MRDYSITLADRRAPWEAASWADGQKPISQIFATASEMLEAAGMNDWNVRKVAVYAGRKGKIVPGRYATVRADGEVLGDVGRAWTPIQMEQAFAFGDNLVDSGEAKWERAGMFRGGAVCFGAMELAHLDISVPGDDSPIKPYLLVVNSFDASTPLQGVLAYIRPVCTNTFEAARGTDTPYRFSIRHTGTLDGKLQTAREAIGIAFKHTAEVEELTTALALKSIVDEQVLEIFRTSVWPVDADSRTEGQLEAHASTLAYENYLSSPTIDDGIRGTAWGAFNAVTEYVDHAVEYTGRVNDSGDVRGSAILFGSGQARKDRALAALLKV